MALPTYSGTLNRKGAAHLLRRITFGPNKQDIDAFSPYTPVQALDVLFQTTTEPLPPLDVKTGSTWVNAPSTDANSGDGDLQEYFKGWWLNQMLAQGVPAEQRLSYLVREKIVYFLHTHFTAIQSKIDSSRALYFQNVLLRKYALDGSAAADVNLKELTKKISVDNAMLILLDGKLNVKGDPNENYGRELIELYSIGKGLQGFIPDATIPGDHVYYTEQDVRSAALVLSGWNNDVDFSTIDEDTGLPRGKAKVSASLIANQHDNKAKQFSTNFAANGNALIEPDPALLSGDQATEESMLDELDKLIELIYAQPECARNICRKLYRFFVYHTIDDTIDNSIISELVTTFEAGGYKIEPVIKDILGSQHFYDMMDADVNNDKFGAIIKSPLELITETLHFFEYTLPDYNPANLKSFYQTTKYLMNSMRLMGMNFMNPIDVAGFDAYHQYPVYNRAWISTNTLNRRYDFIYLSLTTDSMMSMEGAVNIDLYAYMKLRFADVALTPEIFIRKLVSYLFPMSEETTEITTERLAYFLQQFYKLANVSSGDPLNFWTIKWNTGDSNPANKTDARGMLQDLVNALLQSPEFQLH